MKRILSFVTATFLTVSMFAQVTSHLNSPNRDVKSAQTMVQGDGTLVGQQNPNPTVSTKATLDDPVTMVTVYDLQSNSSVENRLFLYPGDGTLGAIATMAHDNTFSDRGTGYNYFDGSNWGTQPSARIESVRTGWPSYAPWGPNGEIVVAHQSGTTPLIISTRATKGTGAWTQTELYPPAGASGMLWPRMVTNGTDHMNIHIISMTAPTGNGGTVWNDLDGALVYNRSLDGGANWDGWQLLDGMTSSDFLAFSGDSYSWAEPQGDILCFTSGDNWYDQFIMKSTDNGDTWTKTTVWPCPFTFWAGGDTTSNFYCADGTNTLAIDGSGKVHLAFGMQRANGDETGAKFWFPFTDGVVYWNEDMPAFPEFMDWDQLYADGNMIGWVQDTMVWYAATTDLAYYYNSMTSHPNLVIDDAGDMYCVWDEVTTLMDVNNYMLRHLYARASFDNGETWTDAQGLTDDFLYTWSECVFPFVAKNSNDNLYIIMQEDPEAGLQFYGSSGAQGQVAITQNNQTVLTRNKSIFFTSGITESSKPALTVSQNYPNPVRDYTNFQVNAPRAGLLNVQVVTVLGRTVWSSSPVQIDSGNHTVRVDAGNFTSGIYLCKVTLDGETVTRKMIVE
ncbi:MAG: T9SS type A sorting domain-containing protein [Bacteroidales bacterium]|nr:T9SS type A sorting domain-containing protein [Bacteroidales bacterium]